MWISVYLCDAAEKLISLSGLCNHQFLLETRLKRMHHVPVYRVQLYRSEISESNHRLIVQNNVHFKSIVCPVISGRTIV